MYLAEIKDQQFIFRELTRKEYKKITSIPDDYGVEETVCRISVLYPEEYDFTLRGRAGMAKTLATEIITASGFAHPNQHVEMMEYYRQDMLSFDAQAETVIGLVFPNVSDEEMQNWTQEQLMKKLARAEWIMKNIWGMNYEFARPEEPKEEEGPVVEPPTLLEIGNDIREQGGDPMLVLQEQIIHKRDKDYVQFPIIGGTKLLGNEEALGYVRKQIQGLPKQ